MQVKDVLKRMVPGEHVAAAHSEYCSYVNSEGVWGDPAENILAEAGHPWRIPTYQFWHLQGADSAVAVAITVMSLNRSGSNNSQCRCFSL